jgi:hypothetical protein
MNRRTFLQAAGMTGLAATPATLALGHNLQPDSYARATAPSLRAVEIACSPATPAPITNTRAGVMVPAAVVSMGKNLGRVPAAISTAL